MKKHLFAFALITLIKSQIMEGQCENFEFNPQAALSIPSALVVDEIFINCLGQEVLFSAEGSIAGLDRSLVSYKWEFHDSNLAIITETNQVSHNYVYPNIYEVEVVVTDNFGCTDTATINTGIVGPPQMNPSEGISACVGTEAVLVADYSPVTIHSGGQISSDLEGPVNDYTPFQSSILLMGFPAGATIDDCGQVVNVHANLTHTWLSDLEIAITCPNGTTVLLSEYPGSLIASENLGEGILGYDYSWSSNAINGTLLETAANTSLSTIPAGEYSASGDLCDLVGCPLNGEWTFNVTDFVASDMGYIWSWGVDILGGSGSIIPLTFTPTIDSDFSSSHWSGLDVLSTSEDGDQALINTEVVHEAILQFTTMDNVGCTFTQDFQVSVIVNPLEVYTVENFIYDPAFPENQYLYGEVNLTTISDYNWSWTPTDGLESPSESSTLVLLPNTNATYTLTATSPQLPGCSSSSTTNLIIPEIVVSGYVFHDANENGIFDATENPMPHFPITYDATGYYSFTDENGYYSVASSVGLNSISLGGDPLLWVSTTPSTFDADLNNEMPESISYDFGLVPGATLVTNVDGTISYSPSLCLQENVHTINISNQGNSNPSGYVVYTCDPLTAYISSTPEPYLIDGTSLYFSFSQIPFGVNDYFSITLQMPDNAITSDDLSFTLETYLTDGSENILVDSDSYTTLLLCSYDPNEIKELNGTGPLGILPPNTDLDYVIHFQNTGNAVAYDVTITDQLPSNVEPTSFQPILSSHAYVATISLDGFVTVQFDNINLPDSGSSYLESNGFIHFRVSQIPELTNGTTILNEAKIYFDANTPITTNTALNTIWQCENSLLGISISEETLTITDLVDEIQWYQDGQLTSQTGLTFQANETAIYNATAVDQYGCVHSSENFLIVVSDIALINQEHTFIYPNPASEMTVIDPGLSQFNIHVYSADGRFIRDLRNVSGKYQMDCINLASGTYFIGVSSEIGTTYQKLIVNHP